MSQMIALYVPDGAEAPPTGLPLAGGAVPTQVRCTSDGKVLQSGASGGGGGSGDASAANQTAQIALETAIRDRLPATLVSGRIPTDGSGVTQPISAAALPLPSGAAVDTSVQAVRDRLPAALGATTAANSLPVTLATDGALVTAVGTTTADAPADGATSGTLIGWLRAAVETLRARLPRRIGEPVTVSIANLAASAVAYAPGSSWIDLGDDWSPAMLIVVGKYNGMGSNSEKVSLECSDDNSGTVIYSGITPEIATFANAQLTFASGGSDAVAQFRPVARYARAKYTNGSTQQGASAVLRVVCGAPA